MTEEFFEALKRYIQEVAEYEARYWADSNSGWEPSRMPKDTAENILNSAFERMNVNHLKEVK